MNKSELDILAKLLHQNELEKFYFLVKDNLNINKDTDPVYLNFLGIYFHKIKDYQNAINYFDSSLKKEKVYAVYLNKCSSLIEIKQFNEAIKLYKELINLKPEISVSYIGASNVYVLQKNYEEAENILVQGLKTIQDFELYYALAKLYFLMRKYDFALQYFDKSIALKNDHADLHNRKALCLEGLDRFEDAKKAYQLSLKLNPKSIDALCNYANLERSMGNFDYAHETYLKVLSLNPYVHEAHRYLSIIKKYKDGDEHLKGMLQLVKDEKFKQNEDKLYQVYFAISKAFEDFNNYEQSIKYLLKGNKFRRKTTVNHNIDYARSHFSTMQAIFDQLDLKKHRGSEDKSPIFILGMPRSGTTLVEQIIASHKDVTSGGELTFVSEIIKEFYPDVDLKEFEKKVVDTLGDKIFEMSSSYLEKTKLKHKNKFLTDKLPNNYTFIGFIKLMFPNCKIIHCKRNPKDNCLSILKNFFPDNGIWFAYDQKELVDFYKLYQEYIEYWKRIFSDQIIEIQYEDLINNQESESKKLISKLELEWDENCLTFYKNKTKVDTLSTAQVRKPIYKDSINLFEKYEKFIPGLFSSL